MDKITFTSEVIGIKTQASFWFSAMKRGFTEQEKHDFSSWLNQETSHRNAFEKISKSTQHSSALNEFSGLFAIETEKKPRKVTIAFITTAASILVAAIVTLAIIRDILFPLASTVLENHKMYTTNVGEQASYKLQDGSTLTLNTNTKVEVNYSESQRKLTLLQGEANFDVVKNNQRPFTVTTGDKSITALGTIFNIQANENRLSNIELLVKEGKVLLSNTDNVRESLNKKLNHTELEYLPGTIIYAGELAVVEENNAPKVVKISKEKQMSNLAWQQGILIFNGEPLEQVLKEISRYSDNTFVILEPKLTKIKVSGLFRTNDINGLLSSLQNNLAIDYKRKKNRAIELSQRDTK
jgi:transmembrane sensor